MSAHTPGPWKATFKTVSAPETEDRLGFECRMFTGNGDDSRANCRLIAAAPKLLEALTNLCALAEKRPGSLYEYKAAVDIARAAIAEATGGAA